MKGFVFTIIFCCAIICFAFFAPFFEDYVVFVDDQDGVLCDKYTVLENTHEICLTLFDGSKLYVPFDDSFRVEMLRHSGFDQLRGAVSWR